MKGWRAIGSHSEAGLRQKQRKEQYFSGGAGVPGRKSEYFLGQVNAVGRKKGTGIGCLVLAAALTCISPVYAYASDYVGTVKVKFTLEGTCDNGQPEIDGETDSTRYSIDEVTTLEEYLEQWEDSDDDDDDDENDRKDNSDLLACNATYLATGDYSEMVYAVLIDAEDEYYFSSDLAKVKVSGLGASCVRLERLHDKTTLVLFVKFADLNSLAGEIETAAWTADGRAAYTESAGTGAAWYELRLYQNGRLTGDKKITGGKNYDFRPLMQKTGIYHYMVRSVSAGGDTGEWKQSDSLQVTGEMAAANRELFALETETDSDGTAPPTTVTYLNTGWQTAEDGRYWYREEDGSYPQENWLGLAGDWYYFDGDGYLATSRYITWGNERYYVNESGRMMTEGKAPDGQEVQPDGRLRWPDL